MKTPVSNVRLMDCMAGMAEYPDKYFELAIVDPPYGGGQHFNFRYGVGDSVYRSDRPNLGYFNELQRVSKDQIVWGGNYFTSDLPESRCWISWYKGNPLPNFSDIELAWASFDKVSRQVNIESYGFKHADKKGGGSSTIHPTQKPIALYEWLLKNYAKPGDKILDTHLGSGSSRIAAYKLGFDFYGFEIDPDYFRDADKRFRDSIAMPLFDSVPNVAEQAKLF